MSLQDYHEDDYSTPYISKLKYDDQDIVEIGVEHSRDPKHKNYIIINSLFKKFAETHDPDKSIILIEGSIQKEILSKEEMISKFGESGFLVWLADKYKINTFCPEPSQEDILTLTNQNFGHPEEILLWVFVNMLNNKPSTKEAHKANMLQIVTVAKILNLKRRSEEHINTFGLSLAKMTNNKISFSTEAELININIDKKILNDLQSPLLKKSILNDVGAAINIAKDSHIPSHKINLLKNSYNIFSVFGKNHTACQEKALEEFIK